MCRLVLKIVLFAILPRVGFAAEITVRTDAAAEFENIRTSEKINVQPGQTATLGSDAPYFVRIENQLPVFLLPSAGTDAEIKLRSFPVKEAFAAQSQKEVSRLLSDVMVKVATVQGLAKQRKLEAAAAKLNDLQRQYPDMPFLKFLAASLAYLQGQKDEAVRLTREGLKAHPDYEDGQKFLKEIEGGTP